MGLLGKLIKTGLDVVTAPIEIVKDVATMGGACTDQHEPYTIKRLKRIGRDVEEVTNEAEKL